MITIKTEDNGEIKLTVTKGTPYRNFIVGIEMLIEELKEYTGMNIDDVLDYVKRIYERDKEDRKKDMRGDK